MNRPKMLKRGVSLLLTALFSLGLFAQLGLALPAAARAEAAPAEDATIYLNVITGLDGTGDGSANNPVRTFNHALDILPETGGTIVSLAAGDDSGAVLS